jgi:tetratricopeptide (TPR) repeat protein
MRKQIILLVTFLIIILDFNLNASLLNSTCAFQKSDSLKACLLKAQSLVKQGKSEEALKVYLEIMEYYPDNKDAVHGWIMVTMKGTQKGPDFLQTSLGHLEKLYPKNTGILFWIAFVEASMGQNDAALDHLNILIKIQPDSAVNYITRGQVLFSMQRYQEAFESFDKATYLNPARPDVWGMKAGALAKIGKFDDAVYAINKGLELAPDNPTNIYNRACIYCLKGDRTRALADLQKAISINPSLKKQAIRDEDFKSLYNDEEFKKLTF